MDITRFKQRPTLHLVTAAKRKVNIQRTIHQELQKRKVNTYKKQFIKVGLAPCLD